MTTREDNCRNKRSLRVSPPRVDHPPPTGEGRRLRDPGVASFDHAGGGGSIAHTWACCAACMELPVSDRTFKVLRWVNRVPSQYDSTRSQGRSRRQRHARWPLLHRLRHTRDGYPRVARGLASRARPRNAGRTKMPTMHVTYVQPRFQKVHTSHELPSYYEYCQKGSICSASSLSSPSSDSPSSSSDDMAPVAHGWSASHSGLFSKKVSNSA